MRELAFKVKHYFQIYIEFFKASLAESLSFRVNFLIHSLMHICFMTVYFFTSIFIFNHVEQIGLWKKEEFLFFISFVLLVEQIHFFMLSLNYWIFSGDIRTGSFDFVLLKPISSIFYTFFNHIAIFGVFTILAALSTLIYFGTQLGLSLGVWISLPLCLFSSLALLMGIEVIISLLSFFTIHGIGVNQARLQVQKLTRWPDFIYKNPARFLLVPFLAITSFPVRWILNFNYWFWFVLMLAGAFLGWLLIIFWLWPRALNLYESASS